MFISVAKIKLICWSAVIVLLIVGVTLFFLLEEKNYESVRSEFHRNAIVSNGPECAKIGMKIFSEYNGTAVDAAIATLFCEGVAVCQSMGLGGGFVATMYNKETGKVDTVVSRERAPLESHKDMFVNMTSVNGILSVAVPGELKGYAEMHARYGRVPWKQLIQPTIDLCRSGHIVTEYLERVMQLKRGYIFGSFSLKEVFVNPATNQLWKAGDRIRRPKLADTLEIIANEGADTMYTANGTIANLLVKDIQELGGIITIDDFVSFSTDWMKPITTELRGGYKTFSVGLPASGMILSLIMNILSGFDASPTVDYFHKMIESFKFGYAKRSLLGDLKYNQSFIDEFSDPKYADEIRSKIRGKTFNDFRHYGAEYSNVEDHGTAHVSVLAANGDAVSITSTINGIFGSGVRSLSTGIILNDEMDDFSTPGIVNGFGVRASPANYIAPGKRPLSSMCPIIILDRNNDAIFISGSAGGSRITTAVPYVFVKHVWMNQPLKESVSEPRIHHQLLPMEVFYENGFDAEILDGLRKIGHNVTEDKKTVVGFAVVTAISRARGFIEATFDSRRFGSIDHLINVNNINRRLCNIINSKSLSHSIKISKLLIILMRCVIYLLREMLALTP